MTINSLTTAILINTPVTKLISDSYIQYICNIQIHLPVTIFRYSQISSVLYYIFHNNNTGEDFGRNRPGPYSRYYPSICLMEPEKPSVKMADTVNRTQVLRITRQAFYRMLYTCSRVLNRYIFKSLVQRNRMQDILKMKPLLQTSRFS